MATTRVAAVADIEEGRIHRVEVGDLELILLKVEGRIRALNGRCPHHNAPLADGLLEDNRLLCPWHQSVFRATDGELLEPPALDCLETYEVEVDGDDVLVTIPDDPAPGARPDMAGADPAADGRTVVMVGAGAAGLSAAQELRRCGFRGRLIMLSDDPQAPYDRTQCSKDYLSGEAPPEWMPLKPASFYTEVGIERIEHRLDALDLAERRITLPGGAVIEADGLLLATGGEPRRLDVEGANLEGVVTLRTWADADRLAELAGESGENRRVVVIGASFIAMEAAASLGQRGVGKVIVVAPEEVPFEASLGKRLGTLLRGIHERHGVDFRLGRSVKAFTGDDRVRGVTLDDGTELDADLVLMGVGVRPATDFLRGIELEPDGSVLVDELLRVRDGVYAAGDIATFPDWRTGEPTRIEHWRLAQQQGAIAGRNLAGEVQPFRAVPFFWTMQYDAGIGYVGHAPAWDDEIVHGDLEGRDFMLYYVRGDRVLAAAAMGRDRQLNALHELMQLEREPRSSELGDGDLDLVARLGTPA